MSSFHSHTRARRCRVLLVDDDTETRELFGAYLEDAGYEVAHADNGAIGCRLALGRTPDAIVMDLEMPVMGGLEALKQLASDARTRRIPVIVVSGNGPGDGEKVREAGCRHYLGKPLPAVELEAVVRSVARAAQAERSRG